jgi:SecD/SecF fusion protein
VSWHQNNTFWLISLLGGLIMPRWLVVLLVLFVGFILLSMAAFIALPLILQDFLPKVGTVLVYEMEDLKSTQDASTITTETAVLLDRRLNAGLRLPLAKVRVIEGNRIEVGVYGNDPSKTEKVADLVESNGKLEFRILANAHKHEKEIEIAKNDLEKSIYYDSTGKNWIARWVKIRQGVIPGPQNLTRERAIGNRRWTEVLVVNDVYKVTSDFLASARPGNENGKPCILISFTSKGGQLFGMLTSDNLPDSMQPELKNQLGIILDGVMYTAPNIQATITDHAQITGEFTPQEVEQIVACLNAGSLPVNLRKVEERAVGVQ